MAPPPPVRKGPERPTAKPLPRNRFAEMLESLGPWRNTFFGALAIGAMYVGFRIDVVRPYLALLLAFGAPIAAMGFAVLPLRESPAGRLGTVALALCGVLLLGMEASIGLVFFPPTAAGTVTLTPGQPDADIAVPDSEHDLDVQVRGQLATTGPGEGHYSIHVTRQGGYDDNLDGQISRVIGREQRAMRRAAPTRTVTVTEVITNEIDAPGHGPVHLHLDAVDGQIHHAVRVSVTHAPFYLHLVPWLAGALLLALGVVEVLLAKRGRQVPLLAGAGIAAALGVYVTIQHDPDDPLSTLTGGLIVALVVGGVGGYLLARIATFLAGTPEHEEAEEKPAAGRKRSAAKRRPRDQRDDAP